MGESFPIPFGRYQLVERLAVGGMAELFKATVSGAHGFEKIVVIKRILPHLSADEHFNEMFIDEAKITARLSHPKIAQTIELGKFNGQLYIAMEYVDGLDALAILRECAHRRARIPVRIGVFIVQEVLDALDFAHNQTHPDGQEIQIVHRDISPSNVLVSRRGDVKLVDFGIAQVTAQDHGTKGGALKGKYGYMSPEQVVGDELDNRSDLFSTAIVLAEILMGRRLFTSANELDVLLMVRDVRLDRLEKYGKKLDPGLKAILEKALSKERGDRFQTAAEFREMLSEWLFEHRHRVSTRDVAALVGELYDDAWSRKREQVLASPPGLPAVADEPKIAASSSIASTGRPPPAPPESSPPVIPADASAQEVMRIIAGAESDGIQIDVDSSDSVPLALIETGVHPVLGSEPLGSVAVGGASAEVEPAPVELPENYDLGDLVAELDAEDALAVPVIEQVSGPSAPVVETSTGLPAGFTTQEIAFDDIVAAVESALPLDEMGHARAPSEQEMAEARERRPANVGELDHSPDDQGDLATTSPLRILARLARARATGLLVVQVGGIKKQIYFGDGRPEYVSSNVASELFGEYLVSQQVISDGELSMALAMMPHYSGKLGDTLVGLGLMKPLDVFRHLSRQVREKLVDVCSWTKGTFAWHDSLRNEREAFPLDLDPYDVIGGGALAIHDEHIDLFAQRVAQVVFSPVRDLELQPENFRIGSEVRTALDRLDGRQTVSQLVGRFTDAAARQRFLRMLFLLVQAELAQQV